MNLARILYLITYPNRIRHRLGYSVQSPWAYDMVHDVLFEKLHYYAYADMHLDTPADRQLWRIENYFGKENVHYISQADDASQIYEQCASLADVHTALVVDGILDGRADLWRNILQDSRATVTFEMYNRGLVTFDKKRIKQNYTL